MFKLFRRRKVAQEVSLGHFTDRDLRAMTVTLGVIYKKVMEQGGMPTDTDVLVSGAAAQVWQMFVSDAYKGSRVNDPGAAWVNGVLMGYRLAGLGLALMAQEGEASAA